MKTEESWGKAIVGGAVMFLLGYVIVGGMSLVQVAAGENIPYMDFWHAPWRVLLQWLGVI